MSLKLTQNDVIRTSINSIVTLIQLAIAWHYRKDVINAMGKGPVADTNRHRKLHTNKKVAAYLTAITVLAYIGQSILRTLYAPIINFFANDIACVIYIYLLHISYHWSKASLYALLTARLHLSYVNTRYEYSLNKVIYPLYLSTIAFIILTGIGDYFEVKSSWSSEFRWCDTDQATWGILVTIGWDMIATIVCLILFIRPLRKMMKQIKQARKESNYSVNTKTKNNNNNKNKNKIQDDTPKLIRKYCILTGIALVTSIIPVLLAFIFETLLIGDSLVQIGTIIFYAALSLDNLTNVICVLLFIINININVNMKCNYKIKFSIKIFPNIERTLTRDETQLSTVVDSNQDLEKGLPHKNQNSNHTKNNVNNNNNNNNQSKKDNNGNNVPNQANTDSLVVETPLRPPSPNSHPIAIHDILFNTSAAGRSVTLTPNRPSQMVTTNRVTITKTSYFGKSKTPTDGNSPKLYAINAQLQNPDVSPVLIPKLNPTIISDTPSHGHGHGHAYSNSNTLNRISQITPQQQQLDNHNQQRTSVTNTRTIMYTATIEDKYVLKIFLFLFLFCCVVLCCVCDCSLKWFMYIGFGQKNANWLQIPKKKKQKKQTTTVICFNMQIVANL